MGITGLRQVRWLCNPERSLTYPWTRYRLILSDAVAQARRHVSVCARVSRVDQRKAGLTAVRSIHVRPGGCLRHPTRHRSTQQAMVAVGDVAQRAGVSTSTVSHVLNGTRCVSAELRRRVHMATVASPC